MSSLIRREPFEGLISFPTAMDRIRRFSKEVPLSPSAEVAPALDLYETKDAIIVKVAMPGIDPEEIEVTIEDHTLTIKGESKAAEDDSERNYVHRERRYGKFYRTITLPRLSGNEAQAEYENGLLTLTFPKREESKRRSIKIKSK